ncbi:hypothetical protein E4U54_007632, partial [Claviceps lovelessii]
MCSHIVSRLENPQQKAQECASFTERPKSQLKLIQAHGGQKHGQTAHAAAAAALESKRARTRTRVEWVNGS